MSAAENVKKFKDILDEAKNARLDSISAWYPLFNLREDPFSTNVPKDDVDLFVNQEDIVKSIIFDIGVSKRGIPIVSLLAGPVGSGKTSILSYINTTMKQLSKQDEYRFNGRLESMNQLFEKDDDDEESLQRWINLSVEKYDYFFFDDASPIQVASMMQHFVKTNFKLFSIRPQNVEQAIDRLNTAPNVFYMKPMKVGEARNMLDRRIKRALLDQHSNLSVDSFFDYNAIKTMVKFCFGIPKLILKCASTSLHILRELNRVKMTDVNKITKELAEISCIRIKCHQAYNNYNSISGHKSVILMQIMDKAKTPTEISSEIKKDRTTVSRHLHELHELGLAEFSQRGRESYYCATEAVQTLVDVGSMPKDRWPIDTD